MPFITNHEQDPHRGRLTYLIYGWWKTGKTSLLLRMLKEHSDQVVYLLSADKGDKQVSLTPRAFPTLAIARPTTLGEWRADVKEVADRVDRLISQKKRKAHNIWVAVDTISHCQVQLLAESRKLAVSVARSGKGRIESDDEYVRDALTQVDYNVNLGHMAEITNALGRLPCNVVYIALERREKSDEGANPKGFATPSLSGQALDKIAGDADVVARLVADDAGKRTLHIAPGSMWTAGDRTGRLSATEPADIWALHQKWLGALPAEPEPAPAVSGPVPEPAEVQK